MSESAIARPSSVPFPMAELVAGVPGEDERAVAAAAWVEGTVIENRRWTDRLFSLLVRGVPLEFEAGQFAHVALDVAGERVTRPFSIVNPPQDGVLEFYCRMIPQGPLSPRLNRLEAGDTLHVAPRPSGRMVLSEVPDGEALWLIATGTGLGPFLSILRTGEPWRRFDHVVVVHAVRYARELSYRDVIRATPARDVTIVSGEPGAGSLVGRIPALLRDGRLEAAAGLKLGAASQVMLCGNPQMLRDTTAALAERGLSRNRRSAPGNITVEIYW
jgi:ferredoxin--NADP+ reductase